MLIVTNLVWLALEYLWLDTSKHIQFSIIRLVYFGFLGTIRAEGTIQRDNTDFDTEEKLISNEAKKAIKIWFYDVLSWCLLIWIFGRSIM